MQIYRFKLFNTRWLFVWMVLLLITLGSSWSLTAYARNVSQQTCPSAISDAFRQYARLCSNGMANLACYGGGQVSGTWVSGGVEAPFSGPFASLPIDSVRSVTTALGLTPDQTGVASLTYIPGTWNDQPLNILLLGDTRLSLSARTEPFLVAEPFNIAILTAVDLYAEPNPAATVIGAVPMGELLPADAVSGDALWFRIQREGVSGWISRDSLFFDPLSPAGLSIAQLAIPAFSVQTAMNDLANCSNQPPSLLLIQGQGYQVSINGLDIRVTGASVVHTNSDGSFELAVINGETQINTLVIAAGSAVSFPLDGNGLVIMPAQELTPRLLASGEIETLALVSAAISSNTVQLPAITLMPGQVSQQPSVNPVATSVPPTVFQQPTQGSSIIDTIPTDNPGNDGGNIGG